MQYQAERERPGRIQSLMEAVAQSVCRTYIRQLALTVVMLAVCASCSKQESVAIVEQSSPKSNLVLIVADTLRADRIDFRRNGKPLMPHLARFAGQSWDFRKCRVQATWTKPSMATLFTSLYPEVHRVLYGVDGDIDLRDLPKTDVLPELFETFAEFMKSNGYRTMGLQTNANITQHFGFGQGFDRYEYLKYPKHHGDAVTDRALEWLDELSPPYLLYVHYMDAHAPYNPPEEFVDPDAALPTLTEEDKAIIDNYGDGYRDRIMFEVGITKKRVFGNLSKAGEEYIRVKYDSSVRFVDAEIGRLIDRILERDPNTIIVVTSDHGEELWEHGSIGHAKTVYEELTRVPLIVRVPGTQPRTIDAPVELIDVLPTCASLLGLKPNPDWQGHNLNTDPGRLPVDRPTFSSATMSITGSNRDLDAVVIGNRKLVVDNIAQTRTIYDLDTNPTESIGVPASEYEGAGALDEALSGRVAADRDHPLYQAVPTTNELTPEQQENIRNIGYLR